MALFFRIRSGLHLYFPSPLVEGKHPGVNYILITPRTPTFVSRHLSGIGGRLSEDYEERGQPFAIWNSIDMGVVMINDLRMHRCCWYIDVILSAQLFYSNL